MKIKEKYYRFAEKGQQIQRVNRFLVTEYLIFYAFILFMLWASRAKGVRSLGFTAFVSVIAVVSGGALLIGWKRRPESERLRYLALIGLYLVSFFMTFAYTESFIRFLGLAPFIGCILFFDPKYSRIGGIGYLVLNALTVFGQIRQQPEGVAGTTNLVLDLLALGVLVFPVLFSIVLFFGILISGEDDDNSNSYSPVYSGRNLSADVLKHQPMVEKYARENGISEYVNVLLAIIQVESGGTAEDVMQSSESLGLPPNSLDTESSIKQGCKYFASLLSSCKNQGIDDLNVAIQSYNYGGGYVGYVAGKGKKHTFNLAESFAREKSGGKKVTYTNPIAVAKNGGWRYGYGNMFYVEVVNQYLAVPQVSGELAQKVMNEALKYQGWKYVYGGSNPNTSFDCSGLTQWCYGKAGISLPRTAQAQYDATQHLPLSQAKAGDLVFFHSTYNAGSYVTHVGILVSPTQMYHAGDPIGYADLSSSYWQQHLIGAGRVKQ